MSSRTPEECIELAVDESAEEGRREDAIRELKLANECDELARLARMDDLPDRYREQAVAALATPQCDTTLRALVEDGDAGDALDGSLWEEAERLLAETEERSE